MHRTPRRSVQRTSKGWWIATLLYASSPVACFFTVSCECRYRLRNWVPNAASPVPNNNKETGSGTSDLRVGVGVEGGNGVSSHLSQSLIKKIGIVAKNSNGHLGHAPAAIISPQLHTVASTSSPAKMSIVRVSEPIAIPASRESDCVSRPSMVPKVGRIEPLTEAAGSCAPLRRRRSAGLWELLST